MKASKLVDNLYDTQSVTAQVRKIERGGDIELQGGSLALALSALGESNATDKRAIHMLRPEDLRVIEGLNPRVPNEGYKAHIRMLVESMKTHGFYDDKPLGGYVSKENGEDVILIIEGGSRLAAAIIAKAEGASFDRIPVVIGQAEMSPADILVMMSVSNTGRKLTPFELGVVCRQLVDFGRDTKRIAQDLGFTQQYVEMLLKLMAADYRVKDMVAHELVTVNNAVDMINRYGTGAYERLAAALDAAQKAGKKKVTGRFLASTIITRAAKKVAPEMYDMLKDIKSDPCFAGLSDSTQERLLELLASLEQIENEAELKETKKKAKQKPRKIAASDAVAEPVRLAA